SLGSGATSGRERSRSVGSHSNLARRGSTPLPVARAGPFSCALMASGEEISGGWSRRRTSCSRRNSARHEITKKEKKPRRTSRFLSRCEAGARVGRRPSAWQIQQAGLAGLEAEEEPRAARIPGERTNGAAARPADQDFRGVGKPAEQHEPVGVADGENERARVEGDFGYARLAHAAFARRLAHRPVLVLERPHDR